MTHFLNQFLRFRLRIDLRALFDEMRCSARGECFHTNLRKEVNFSKSMIRDFKHFFRYLIFQFRHVGLCSNR